MKKLVIIVSSDDRSCEPKLVRAKLDALAGRFEIIALYSTGGNERAFDATAAARAWARQNGVRDIPVYPDWERNGKRAGYMRNSKLVTLATYEKDKAGASVAALLWAGAEPIVHLYKQCLAARIAVEKIDKWPSLPVGGRDWSKKRLGVSEVEEEELDNEDLDMDDQTIPGAPAWLNPTPRVPGRGGPR